MSSYVVIFHTFGTTGYHHSVECLFRTKSKEGLMKMIGKKKKEIHVIGIRSVVVHQIVKL